MARFSDDFICLEPQPPVTNGMAVRPVLWPVHVWQVYGPDLSGKSTNIFERSLLSLLSMKTSNRLDTARIDQLAKWLGLESDMVTYIIEQQLKPNGWIDNKTGWLTKKGHEALQADTPNSSSLRVGYIFQDAFEGGFIPRYVNQLKFVEPSVTTNNQLEFNFSKASSWVWRPILIRANNEPLTPNQHDLHQLLEETHQAKRNALLMDNIDEDSFRYLSALKLSDRESFSAFLWVWVYTVAGLEHVWAAADPFGLHPNAQWIRAKIEKACGSVPSLSRNIMQMIGVEEHEEFSSLRDALAAREEQARLEVLTEYSQAEKIDGLIGLLHGWTNRKLDIETSNASDRYHDYRDLITQSSSLIEHCIRFCLENYPLKNPYIIPKNCNKKDLKRLIIDAVPSLSNDQLHEVVQVTPSAVFNAAIYKQGAFRRCFAACLLSIPDYPDHPLKNFLNIEELFLDTYRLSHWRDGAAHGETRLNLTKKMSLEAAYTTAYFLQIFFKGLDNGQK